MIATLGTDGGNVLELREENGRRTLNARPLAPTAEGLFRVMSSRQIEVLHIHASALPLLGLPVELGVRDPGEPRPPHPWLAFTLAHEAPSSRALAPSITWQAGTPRAPKLELMVGAWQDSGDPFGDAADGAELLAAHVAFRDAFVSERLRKGWAYRHNAVSTGWLLMHELARRSAQLREHPNELPELPGIPTGTQVEQAFGGKWARARGDWKPLRWVHAYDINGQRLAACSRLSLGIAGLERRLPSREFDKRLPGYHLVNYVSHPHGGDLPPIFEAGWHTTPRVAMALHLGFDVKIVQSIVFTIHAPYLNPWYDAMRDARSRLMNVASWAPTGSAERELERRGCELALRALKATYLQPLGRLRSRRLRDTGSHQYRPHWYDHVIGQELGREWLRLHNAVNAGVRVLAVYFDTIVIESDLTAVDAAKQAGLEVSSQLGKFGYIGSAPASVAHEALYTSPGHFNVGALIDTIKKGPDESTASLQAGGQTETPQAAGGQADLSQLPEHEQGDGAVRPLPLPGQPERNVRNMGGASEIGQHNTGRRQLTVHRRDDASAELRADRVPICGQKGAALTVGLGVELRNPEQLRECRTCLRALAARERRDG